MREVRWLEEQKTLTDRRTGPGVPVRLAGDGAEEAGQVLPAFKGPVAAAVGAGALLGRVPGSGGEAGAVPALHPLDGHAAGGDDLSE